MWPSVAQTRALIPALTNPSFLLLFAVTTSPPDLRLVEPLYESRADVAMSLHKFSLHVLALHVGCIKIDFQMVWSRSGGRSTS